MLYVCNVLYLIFVPATNDPFCTYTDSPSVSIEPVNTGISVVDAKEIVCYADSRPLSDITWSTGGKIVTQCKEDTSCHLKVGYVGAGQQMNYTCSARNSVGFISTNITLDGKGTCERIWYL